MYIKFVLNLIKIKQIFLIELTFFLILLLI